MRSLVQIQVGPQNRRLTSVETYPASTSCPEDPLPDTPRLSPPNGSKPGLPEPYVRLSRRRWERREHPAAWPERSGEGSGSLNRQNEARGTAEAPSAIEQPLDRFSPATGSPVRGNGPADVSSLGAHRGAVPAEWTPVGITEHDELAPRPFRGRRWVSPLVSRAL